MGRYDNYQRLQGGNTSRESPFLHRSISNTWKIRCSESNVEAGQRQTALFLHQRYFVLFGRKKKSKVETRVHKCVKKNCIPGWCSSVFRSTFDPFLFLLFFYIYFFFISMKQCFSTQNKSSTVNIVLQMQETENSVFQMGLHSSWGTWPSL